MRLLTCLLLAAASLPAAAQLGFPGDAGVEWSTLTMGQRSRVAGFSTYVLGSASEFENYWRRTSGQPGSPPSGVDFQKYQLVAIHLGNRPTGGFQVSVERIERVQASTIQLNYVEQKPSSDQIVTQALTSPWVVVRVKRVGGNFAFRGRMQVGPFPGTGPILTPGPIPPIWGGVPFETLLNGTNSSARTFRVEVLESQSDYRAHLRDYVRNAEVRPVRVDWGREAVVAIHLGTRSSLGYGIQVNGVEPSVTGLRILWTEIRPAPGSMAGQALVSPFVLVRVPRAPAYDFVSQVRFGG